MKMYTFWEYRQNLRYKSVEVINDTDNKHLGFYSHPKYINGNLYTSFTKFFKDDEEAINYARDYVLD